MKLYTLVILFIALAGCGISTKPINYGRDQCSFCKMAIVDKAHSAQVVTIKGRAYSFDAIECMVDYVNETSEADFAYMVISDFSQPGTMINAMDAHYLISDQIPSPMGAFLSGFGVLDSIKNLPKNIKGETLTWQQLKNAR